MWRLCSLFLAANLVFGCVYSEPVLKVAVDKQKVKTGETFNYTVRIEGTFSSPKISLPEFKGLRVVSQTQTKQYSFKKNKKHVKIVMKYKLIAYYPGEYTIESVVVRDESKKFTSETITIKVVGRPIENREQEEDIFKEGITI